MRLGDVEVLPVLDGHWDVPAEAVLSRVPAHEFLTEDGLLRVQLGGFLVRSGERVVLVDTGFGPDGGPGNGLLLASLAAHGVTPDDVTDVVLTHLHFDHVGWVSDGQTATFPQATYRCDERDWHHFVEHAHEEAMREAVGAMSAPDRLGPVAGRLETFHGDGTLAPGIDLRSAPGHTPGSTVVVLSGGGERALLLGDVLHCPAELLDDDWDMVADVDPALARRTREQVARELEGSGVLAAAGHFPGLRFGRLLAGRTWSYDTQG